MQPNPRSLALKSFQKTDAPRVQETARDDALGEMIDLDSVREGRRHEYPEYPEVKTRIGIGTRVMDAVMGWLFVLGLFVWVYALRGRSSNDAKNLKAKDDHPQVDH
jgi:hypothetical protein